MSDQETLFEFPCEFPLKLMGPATDDFDARVFAIVSKHVPNLPKNALSSKQSKGGKFQSATVTFTATSKPQLDAIYIELSGSDWVSMVL